MPFQIIAQLALSALHNALARMSWESASPLMGSSANVSLTGSKFRLEDVQDSLKNGCDIVLDYGTSPYENKHGIGSTIIELPGWKVLRWPAVSSSRLPSSTSTLALSCLRAPQAGP